MSEAMRRKIEAKKQQAEDAELAPQMSKQQTAEHERTIADILRPRESVLQALKRLRGPTLPRTANRKRSKPNPDQVHHLCCVVDSPTCQNKHRPLSLYQERSPQLGLKHIALGCTSTLTGNLDVGNVLVKPLRHQSMHSMPKSSLVLQQLRHLQSLGHQI